MAKGVDRGRGSRQAGRPLIDPHIPALPCDPYPPCFCSPTGLFTRRARVLYFYVPCLKWWNRNSVLDFAQSDLGRGGEQNRLSMKATSRADPKVEAKGRARAARRAGVGPAAGRGAGRRADDELAGSVTPTSGPISALNPHNLLSTRRIPRPLSCLLHVGSLRQTHQPTKQRLQPRLSTSPPLSPQLDQNVGEQDGSDPLGRRWRTAPAHRRHSHRRPRCLG